MTLEPLQLLQPTPKSLLFNIYHSRLGPQLLHEPGPQAPPRLNREGRERSYRGVLIRSFGGGGQAGWNWFWRRLNRKTESNPMAGKGLKGQFTPVPDLGTVVKLLRV